MIGVGWSSNAFFDAPAVIRAIDSARRKALSRAGAFTRRAMRSLIRRRRKASTPGQPPSSQTGLLRMIQFGYDTASDHVFIGPIALKSPAIVPALLDQGGWTTIRRGKRRRRVYYAPRPYRLRALECSLDDLARQFEGAVR